MAPLEGVIQIKGDITTNETVEKIIQQFNGELADLVVSDGAPDVTGMHDIDEYIQSQLILAALNITTHLLRPGGTFIAKIFRGKDTSLLYSKLKLFFSNVHIAKPKSSRNSSIESFVVCTNFSRIADYVPTMIDAMDHNYGITETQTSAVNRLIVPFVAVGDLSGYDSDRTYPLQDSSGSEYKFLTAVQPPINPPYKNYIEKKRGIRKEEKKDEF
eukprot:TRINITY_DN6136_c0_g1_i1.p1 TRINITY_DN6136_c0_g1~~TRINITY_DN6136_c0_g1_i1.p1  ORF type:complete len:215 (+),score=49.49 TRINITY_DN6136_c0_g1_i1:196-840(+)